MTGLETDGRNRPNSPPGNDVPVLPGFDSTFALLREGYGFGLRRFEELGTDIFRTRLMLKEATFLRGPSAARAFYTPGRITRRGALPSGTVALLQGKESVQGLDGAAHRRRKALFTGLLTREACDAMGRHMREELETGHARHLGERLVLQEHLAWVLTRVALRWCGIGPREADPQERCEELTAMVEGAGRLGPARIRARALRRRCESWASALIEERRRSEAGGEGDDDGGAKGVDTPLERIARHIDADGAPLPTGAAAQELINLLRPIVAVGRFITFALHAKHQLAEDTWREPGKLAPAELAAFVEEVRRVSPFFPLMGGRVLEPFAWNGTGFAEGDWLILDIYATHRHPEGWQAPERFAPERHLQPTPPGATLAQGHGDPAVTHACPGEPLTQHLMAEALRHFAEVRYAVAAQDLSIPLTTFATGPRDGMVIIPRPEAEEAAAAAPS